MTPAGQNTTTKTPGKILITGAIADHGTVISTNAAKKPTAKGAYKLLRLKNGTILVDGTQLGKALTAGQPSTLNASNCSAIFGATAPVTLSSGTGAYVGISGTVTITATFAFIGPKTKSGTCTMKTSAQPVGTYSSITGSGTVSFSLVATDACGAVIGRTIDVWRSRLRRWPGCRRRSGNQERGRRS